MSAHAQPEFEGSIQSSLRPLILACLGVPLALLTFGIYHGLVQVLLRAGLIHSDGLFGIGYYQGLTAHGVINAIVLTTFFAVGFGHYLISQHLKLRISSGLAWSGFFVMILGAVSAAFEIFMGRASVLYTFYPPLQASPVFYSGLVLFVVGSWISFWAWIGPYRRWRRENKGEKTPLPVVGIFVTFIIWQLCTLPVAYEILVLLLPWSLGLVDGVNTTLARTLFWFFGHPLVYFWLIPAYIMYYSMLPKVAGGKLYSDFAARFALMSFVVLSIPLGLHHQYADPGIAANWKALHAVLTSLVAIPSLMTAFTVAASLEIAGRARGGRGLFHWWTRLPFFSRDHWFFPYLFCGLLIFIFGGMTGVINASYNVNLVVHNTSWIPAHFHLTVGGPVFLAIIGCSLYLISGLLGKSIAFPRINLAVPYLWMFGVMIMSSGMFISGLQGEPRRTNLGLSYTNPDSPLFEPSWIWPNYITVLGGSLMTLAMIFYFGTLLATLLKRSETEKAKSFALPVAEPYHNELIPGVLNFKPWIVAAIIFIVIGYYPPLLDIYRSGYPSVPGFHYNNPLPIPPSTAKMESEDLAPHSEATVE